MKKSMILILFLFVLFSISVNAVYTCVNVGSTTNDTLSNGNDCTVTDSSIRSSNIYSSNVTRSSITNSHLENFSVFDATIVDNILSSGRIKYGMYTYYPLFNVTRIYYELSISAGQFYYPVYVKNNSIINISYTADGIGYTVLLNLSLLDNTKNSLLQLFDNGVAPDLVASDNILTGVYTINSSNSLLDGSKNIFAIINDNKGNVINSTFNITLDNTVPNSTLFVVPIGQPGFPGYSTDYTAIKMVTLETTFVDNMLVKDCRYANDDLIYSNWETCTAKKTFYLTDVEGGRSILYQVRDQAGNIDTSNDSIIYNKTGLGLDTTPPTEPTVVDQGDWTRDSTSLTFSWYNSTDIESTRLGLPVLYKFYLNDSNGNDINPSIGGWNDSLGTATQVTISDLSLAQGVTYYLNVIAYNALGNESNISISDGIALDTTNPSTVTITSSAIGSWSNTNSFSINWSATDSYSGIKGYSFVLSRNRNITLGNVSVNQTSKNFGNIAPGNYYFHIKAGDNAGNWGPLNSSISIGIDTNRPTTPQLINQSIISNSTNLTINWTISRDITSGISYYILNISQINTGQIVYYANVGNVTNFMVTQNISSNTLYYVNVRAVDLAGNPSDWSSSASIEIDTTAPSIDLLKPRGAILGYSPYFAIQTNEKATCSFTEDTGNEIAPANGVRQEYAYTYTDSKYHESLIQLNSNLTSFTFTIQCMDAIGNWNSTSISFSISTSNPNTIGIENDGNYYSNTIKSIDLRVSSSSLGIGEISRSTFNFVINNTPIYDYSILDKGDGNYTLTFNVPDDIGEKTLLIQWYGASYSKIIDIQRLNYKIRYSDLGLDPHDSEHISYSQNDYYTVGVSMMNISNMTTNNNSMLLESNDITTDSMIFMTKSNARPANREDDIKSNKFFKLLIPSFGYVSKEEFQDIKINLDYLNINLTGIQKIYPGYFELEVVNQGTVDGITTVEINYKREESETKSVVQWS